MFAVFFANILSIVKIFLDVEVQIRIVIIVAFLHLAFTNASNKRQTYLQSSK